VFPVCVSSIVVCEFDKFDVVEPCFWWIPAPHATTALCRTTHTLQRSHRPPHHPWAHIHHDCHPPCHPPHRHHVARGTRTPNLCLVILRPTPHVILRRPMDFLPHPSVTCLRHRSVHSLHHLAPSTYTTVSYFYFIYSMYLRVVSINKSF
jgi:hypothetical protein